MATRRDAERRHIVVEVRDTGMGVLPEHLDRIFEPFFTTKPQGVGTGLGLSLCIETIRGHGGTIEVQSEVGKGTSFTVRLPEDTGLVATQDSGTFDLPPSGAVHHARVLLIDDEASIIRTFTRILRRDHEIVTYSDPLEAVTHLQTDANFDVVLCDLMMPTMDGPRFYQLLSEGYPHLLDRLVFVSGGAVTPRAQEFVATENIVTLEKPVRPSKLRAIVQRIAGSRASG